MCKFITAFIALFLISCDGTYTSYSYDPTPATTVRYIPTQTLFARERLRYTTSQYYVPYYGTYRYRTYCPPTYRYSSRPDVPLWAHPTHKHSANPVRVRTSKYESKSK